jgi:hypothetical protein
MKRILLCGMLLAFLTSMSFAQRGRGRSGVGPTAITPAPSARVAPNAIGIAPSTVPPNARTGGAVIPPSAVTVAPRAEAPASTANPVAPAARTTSPETVAPKARTIPPDAQQ